MMTLESARRWLAEHLRDGVTCPLCTQFAKVYRRKIHAGMTRLLIAAYREFGTGEFHVNDLHLAGGGDFAKFRYWGLVEQAEAAGRWTLTADGVAFVEGRLRVPSHAEVYNDALLGLTGNPVSIRDVVGFKYDELMGSPGTLVPAGVAA